MSNQPIDKIFTLGHNLDRDAETPVIEKIAGLFPRRFMSIVAAQAGTGKTWFMQYIACRLSCGGNILNGLVPNSPQLRTLIFAGETGKDLLNLRLKATCWSYQKEYIRIYDAVELQVSDIPILLDTTEGRETLIAILNHEQPDIVFFDTLISFHGADESKQSEMTGIYTFLLKAANAFDCAIVLNHHTRKRSNKQSSRSMQTQDDVIGSNSGVRLASNVFILAKDGDELTEDEGMPTIRVTNVKSWDKRTPSFTYQFIEDPATRRLDFGISWGTTAENENWSLRERISTLVDAMETGAMCVPDGVAQEVGTSTENARNYLEELSKKGILERTKFMNKTAWRKV